MTCRNIDPTTAHTCGSNPTGALMSYDAQGQLATWAAPSGTVGSAHYLYDNEGNRVLTNAATASSTTNTISFDGSTKTVLSSASTSTTKYYSLNRSRVAARMGGSTLDYLVSDLLRSNTIALNFRFTKQEKRIVDMNMEESGKSGGSNCDGECPTSSTAEARKARVEYLETGK